MVDQRLRPHNCPRTTKMDRLFSLVVGALALWSRIGVFASSSAYPKLSKHHPLPKDDVNWEGFNFSLNGVETDAMWVNKVLVGQELFSTDDSALRPMGTLNLSPAATVFNYGQALFEGMKAFRRQDGSIVLFRPESNAWRMQQGAERFLLPPVPTDVFITAAENVVRANARWVPPFGKGAFYLRKYLRRSTEKIEAPTTLSSTWYNIHNKYNLTCRFRIAGPLLMGTGAALGVKPSHEATFCVFGSPVGSTYD